MSRKTSSFIIFTLLTAILVIFLKAPSVTAFDRYQVHQSRSRTINSELHQPTVLDSDNHNISNPPNSEILYLGVPIQISVPAKPTKAPIPPKLIKKQTGIVFLSAYTMNEKKRIPFKGSFFICTNHQRYELDEVSAENSASLEIQNDDNNFKSSLLESCLVLQTNKFGKGHIRISEGYYTIRSPYYCPPEHYCITNQNQPQVIFPFTWEFRPNSFYVRGGKVVRVQALRQS